MAVLLFFTRMFFRILSLTLILIGTVPCLTASTLSSVLSRSVFSGNETLDWGAFGPTDTDISSGSSVTIASGILVTVSQPEYGLQIREEGLAENLSGAWKGDFLPVQMLLTNWNSPFAVTLTFSQPVYGAGLQIEPGQVQDLPADFTASVTAYDGTEELGQFSTAGIRALAEDGSAPFLGVVSDTAEITSLTYSVLVSTNVRIQEIWV